MTWRAPALGWGALLAAAVVAAQSTLSVQLGFAIIGVGVIGLAHGASDLAIVDYDRRSAFLGYYGLVTVACLGWWIVAPAVALPAFLCASALHFGLEDAPADRSLERLARGVSLVSTPATLHLVTLTKLLLLAGVPRDIAPAFVVMLAVAGTMSGAGLIAWSIVRHDRRLMAGTAALLLFPPLVGFPLGFLILHAMPQTIKRSAQLGCATSTAYLRQTWPILLAAIIIVGGIGGLVLRWDPTGVRSLFAAIAALAMPHLLVTPWFEQRLIGLSPAKASVRFGGI